MLRCVLTPAHPIKGAAVVSCGLTLQEACRAPFVITLHQWRDRLHQHKLEIHGVRILAISRRDRLENTTY